MRRALALWALLLPATAAARERTWLAVSGIYGAHDLGEGPAIGGGGLLSLGRSFGALQLVAEYSVEKLDPPGAALEAARPEAVAPLMLQSGTVLGRLAWWRLGSGAPGYMDLALEAGVGRSAFVDVDGATRGQTYFAAGVSSLMLVNLAGGAPRDWGITFGLRFRAGEDDRTSLLFFAGLAWGM
jgi:hypothetical protein